MRVEYRQTTAPCAAQWQKVTALVGSALTTRCVGDRRVRDVGTTAGGRRYHLHTSSCGKVAPEPVASPKTTIVVWVALASVTPEKVYAVVAFEISMSHHVGDAAAISFDARLAPASMPRAQRQRTEAELESVALLYVSNDIDRGNGARRPRPVKAPRFACTVKPVTSCGLVTERDGREGSARGHVVCRQVEELVRIAAIRSLQHRRVNSRLALSTVLKSPAAA